MLPHEPLATGPIAGSKLLLSQHPVAGLTRSATVVDAPIAKILPSFATYIVISPSRLLETQIVSREIAMQAFQGCPLVGCLVEDCPIWLPSGGAGGVDSGIRYDLVSVDGRETGYGDPPCCGPCAAEGYHAALVGCGRSHLHPHPHACSRPAACALAELGRLRPLCPG